MPRQHNFSAGPAVLPLPVIEALQAALPEFGGARAGIMEISHRSRDFGGVIDQAEARLRSVLAVPADHKVLFLQGGASLQFLMSALNIAGPDDRIDYLETGTWSVKAVKEAKRVCDAANIWSSKAAAFDHLPPAGEPLATREGALAVHYTSNNTVAGTQYAGLPETALPLIGDLSSDICSRPVDVARHAVLYAGAQKNLGPSGVTAVILSPWAVERSRTVDGLRPGGLPSMLSYGLMVDKGSMFNTPNTFGIFALERVLAWMQDRGGVAFFAQRNEARADRLYGVLDGSDFWQPRARPECRSRMNITWRIHDEALEPVFVAEADAAGLLALKGHRSMGGIRASLYNALPDAAVDALIDFMGDFERRHG
jgi:phosphoserine aminotransferase